MIYSLLSRQVGSPPVFLVVSDVDIRPLEKSRKYHGFWVSRKEYSHLRETLEKDRPGYGKRPLPEIDFMVKDAVLVSIKGCHIAHEHIQIQSIQAAIHQKLADMAIAVDGLIIIGATDGLEQHLVNDVYYMARAIGMNHMDADRAVRDMAAALANDGSTQVEQNSRLTYECRGTRHDGAVRVRVVWNPTWAELECTLETLFSNTYGLKTRICYCGHGNERGCMELFDGMYSGFQLRCLLDRIKGLPFYPQVDMIFNCCYALDIVVSAADCGKAAAHAIFPRAPDLAHSKNLESDLKAYESEFIRSVHDVHKKVGDNRGVLYWMWDNNCVFATPLSNSPLRAAGALQEVFDIQEPMQVDDDLRQNVKRFATYRESTWKQAKKCIDRLPLTSPANIIPAELRPPPEGDVRVRLLQGLNGDSTLLQTSDLCVLIGGGHMVEGFPACWQHVRHLSAIDLIILTHADCDHVDGLLPLLWRKKHEPTRGPPIHGMIMQADQRDYPTKRGWRHANELAALAKPYFDSKQPEQSAGRAGFHTAITQGKKIRIPWSKEGAYGTKLTIQCVLPDEKFATEAMEALATYRNLSPINYTGIVIIATVRLRRTAAGRIRKRRLLFTGDADGTHIVSALDTLYRNTEKHCFDYIDMPHDGTFSCGKRSCFFAAC